MILSQCLEHVEEILQNRKERAELRQKIRRSVRELNKILTKVNKQRNVKEDMKGFVTKALLILSDQRFRLWEAACCPLCGITLPKFFSAVLISSTTPPP